MQYDLFEEWRDENFFRNAGESMQKKANYLRLGIYELSRLLEDPNKVFSYQARKDMASEKRTMNVALERIFETYQHRCSDLKARPELLKAFQDGFLGS